ncbi:MAG: CehA/McbA family metallohydrolase [Gaiellaceae bacterium]
MAVIDPWTGDGNWLRCALHAHTTRSDGELAPRHLARHYARAGYDVLAVTDHWRVTGDDSVDGLIVVPSVELNCVLPGARDGHVLGFGVSASEADLHALAREHADLAGTATWIESHGGIAYLAHPYWTGVAPGLELPSNVVGLEVYNAGCELEVGRGLSAVHWDELLEAGRLCPAIAADDSHHPGYDSDLAWTWLKASARSGTAVLEALATGCYYASTGPRIYDVRRDGDAVEVRCSPCRSVTLVSGRTAGAAVNVGRLGYRHAGRELECDAAGHVVHARLDIPPSARHVRVEVVDASGRKAWANPLQV